MKDKPVMHIVGTRCRSEDEARFNKWYDEVHIPMLLKFKGLKGVARYKITSESDEYPTYLATYQYENRQVYEESRKSPELAAALEELQGSWPGGLDIKWRVQYELIKEW
jgi:uncharacterized protein (TIGR02118 family)